MSLLPPSSGAARVFSVPPLTFSGRDGRRYQRRADIETSIAATLRTNPLGWMQDAEALPAEAIVYLIRYISSRDGDIAGNLIFELTQRIYAVARRWAMGFSKTETEEIIHTINQDIIELVLTEKPSRQSEFLEVAFSKTVKRRTLNEVAKVKNSPRSSRKNGDSENSLGARDKHIDALEALLEIQDESRVRELVRKAQEAVRDPRHYEALLLRYGHDWPIDSQDPNQPTLAKRYGVSARQIQNWIANGLENIRIALGVQL
jgi:hypothetical protein